MKIHKQLVILWSGEINCSDIIQSSADNKMFYLYLKFSMPLIVFYISTFSNILHIGNPLNNQCGTLAKSLKIQWEHFNHGFIKMS